MTPNVNTNGRLLKVQDLTLKKNENKPVVLKRRIKSKLKPKTLTRVKITRDKNKAKNAVAKDL